jgi:hypothetical protein
MCRKADSWRFSVGNAGRNILADAALKVGNLRFELRGVALQRRDISSELGRRPPQYLRLAADFPARKTRDFLSERDCNIWHLSFPSCCGNKAILTA